MLLWWSFREVVTCGFDEDEHVPTVSEAVYPTSLELFVGSRSATLAVSVVWFGSLDDVGAVVSMLTAPTLEFDGGDGRVDWSAHVTVLVPEQIQVRIKLVKPTRVDPAGSWDIVLTWLAQSGPKLVTSIL